MKKSTLIFLLLTFCTTAFAGESQLQKATNVLNEIMGAPDKGIPDELLERAVCVGIVPSELTFAFGIGGTYGRGMLVCRRGGNGVWGAPSMFTLGGGSFGLQIGGKSTDVIFVVMNPEGARKLVQDSVKLGAEASAAAGPWVAPRPARRTLSCMLRFSATRDRRGCLPGCRWTDRF
jgi:lipid-binding SYLF domain-containing protein